MKEISGKQSHGVVMKNRCFPSISILYVICIYCSIILSGPLHAQEPDTNKLFGIIDKVYVQKHCPGCDLSEVSLVGADLQNINLKDADLQGANLRGVNLQGANLENATLERVNLKFVNFENSNLKNATLNYSQLTRASFTGAIGCIQ